MQQSTDQEITFTHRAVVVLTAFLMLLIGGCQQASTELSDQQVTTIAAEVDAAAASWWQAWAEMDFDKGMSFVSTAPEATWLGNDTNLYGLAAMTEAWTDWASDLSTQDLEVTESRTFVVAHNMVFTIRNVTGVATRMDGGTNPEILSVETLLWEKHDGEWKILFGHESVLRKSWQGLLDVENDNSQ